MEMSNEETKLDNLREEIRHLRSLLAGRERTEERLVRTERKVAVQNRELARTREELEQQARLLDTVHSAIVDSAYVFDREGRFTYINQALLDLWGMRLEDAVGKTLFELPYPHELAARLQDQVDAVFRAGQPLRDETHYTSPAGVTGYYEYIFVPVFDKNGQVKLVVGSTRDITQRAQAQAEKEALLKALQRERQQMNALFMQSPAFIAFLRGPEHIFEMANPLYLQLVGSREFIGKSVREAFPEIEGQGFLEILDTVYRTGQPFTGNGIPFRFREQTEEPMRERILDFIYQPLFDTEGAVSGIFVHGIDLTERTQAEQALKESQERLQLANETAGLGIWVWEPNGDRVTWENERMYEIYGFSSTDPPLTSAQFLTDIVHPDDAPAFARAIAAPVETGAPLHFEGRFRHRDGLWRWIEFRGRLQSAESGKPLRLAGTAADITEKKIRERTLNLFIEINDATREMQEPLQIMATIARTLGEFLGVSRCAYAPVEEDANHFNIYGDYINGCKSIVGRYPLTALGSKAFADLSMGKTYVIADIDAEIPPGEDLSAYRSTEIKALICTSLVKNNKMVGLMAVHQTTSRKWTPEEVTLVEMVSERSWAIIERAQADKRLQERATEIEALNTRLRRSMMETHHRVKNNLQVISAMIEMQAFDHNYEKSVPIEEYRQLKAHIHTLSIVHDLLSENVKEEEDAQRVSVKAVLDKLLPMLQQTAGNKVVSYSLDDAKLNSRVCISLALVLNELVTNALKHGISQAVVAFRVEGGDASLSVTDDGPGFPDNFEPLQAAHMGLELVESLVRTDLKGRSIYTNRPEGGGYVCVTFALPLEE